MIRIEPVGRIRCQWGEAPIWWQGALYFVDIEGRRVFLNNCSHEQYLVDLWFKSSNLRKTL